MPGNYSKKRSTLNKPKIKAIPTADFNRKIAAIRADPTLTPAQKQTKIAAMKRTRVTKKLAMKPNSKRR